MNAARSCQTAVLRLIQPPSFCALLIIFATRLLLREKMSHPTLAQHLRLDVERCFNESQNR